MIHEFRLPTNDNNSTLSNPKYTIQEAVSIDFFFSFKCLINPNKSLIFGINYRKYGLYVEFSSGTYHIEAILQIGEKLQLNAIQLLTQQALKHVVWNPIMMRKLT